MRFTVKALLLIFFVVLTTPLFANMALLSITFDPITDEHAAPGKSGIRGVVTDATGAAVVGAKVVVSNASGTLKSGVTKEDGGYSIGGLLPGTYKLSVMMEGFSESVFDGVILPDGETISIDASLTPAGAKTEVNVHGVQTTQVETENAEVSGTITEAQILSLPPNGRNFSTLITLAPGVSNQTGQDEAKVGVVGSAKYSVNGGRVEYNTFNIDGNDVLNADIAASHGHTTLLVYPSIDAIQELKVLTSNYGAQYGKSASGTVLVETKAGGTKLHGSAYEFLRNERFNARSYFDRSPSSPIDRRNDFGVTLGGPLHIPGLFTKKDATFFFISEEMRKERTPYVGSASYIYNQAVPSDAERGYNPVTHAYGSPDFAGVCPTPANDSAYADDRVNGYYRAGAPSGHPSFPDCPGVPAGSQLRFTPIWDSQMPGAGGSVDPVASALLRSGIIPRANSTGGCNSTTGSCYVDTFSPETTWREELLRVDHALTSKTKLFASGVHDHWVTTAAVPQWQYGTTANSFPTVLNDFQGPGINVTGHVTSIFSATFLNDLSFSANWQHITLTDQPGSGVNLSRSLIDSLQYPMGYLFQNNSGDKLPGIRIGGTNAEYGGAGFVADTSYMPWNHTRLTGAISDDLTKVINRHTVRFGAQFIYARRKEAGAANGANTGNVQGLLTFSNLRIASTGNAFADFLYDEPSTSGPNALGRIQSYQQDSAQGTYKVRYWTLEPYLQDDWHVTPRLTVNLGLRISLFGNWQPIGQPLYNWQAGSYDASLLKNSGLDINYGGGYLETASGPVAFNGSNVNSALFNGLVECGTNGVPSSCQSSHMFNPAPRLGFAWDPTGQGKTSIRGGYGLFFEHGTGSEANAGSLMGNPPGVLSMTQTNPEGYGSIGIANVSVRGQYPLNVISIPSKVTWPYVQQWSFGVQEELSKGTGLTVSYVGSKGTHLPAGMQLNQFKTVAAANNPFGAGQPITFETCAPNYSTFAQAPSAASFATLNGALNGEKLYYSANPSAYLALSAACTGMANTGNPYTYSLDALRPYQGIGSVYAIRNVADSGYHSMQITLRHLQGPLDLGITYTYSHSIDDASDRFSSVFVDAYNLSSNRASSDFDQRHLLNINYFYKLPLLNLLGVMREVISCPENKDKASRDDGNLCGPLAPYSGPSNLVRKVLSNWALTGITTFQTGTPFSVINGGSSNGVSVPDNAGLALGTGADSYPDLAHGNGYCDTSAANIGTIGPLLKNPCRFVAPEGLTKGNAGRNFLNNPKRMNFDVALLRNFKPVGERVDFQFRAEVFNLFNTTQFIIYDPSRGNTSSNTITCYGNTAAGYSAGDSSCLAGNGFLHPVSAHRPRNIEFAVKATF